MIKTDDIQTACDNQEDICKGINCKTCQFNKIGIDINYFKEVIQMKILDFLRHDKSNIIEQSDQLAKIFIDALIKEEYSQSIIGSKIFKKQIR